MDDKLKLVGVGIVVGAIVVVLLFKVLGAEPSAVSIGPIEFELPTATSVNDLSEESNTIVESGSETQSSSPTATSERSPIPRPANSISEDEVKKLNYGEIAVADVNTNCLNQVHDGSRPFISFVQGDKIPDNVLIATNYFEAGKHWDEFPVSPVCHNGDWGLFESNSPYTAPYEGAYWFIIP